jgi:hypothetical protein
MNSSRQRVLGFRVFELGNELEINLKSSLYAKRFLVCILLGGEEDFEEVGRDLGKQRVDKRNVPIVGSGRGSEYLVSYWIRAQLSKNVKCIA